MNSRVSGESGGWDWLVVLVETVNRWPRLTIGGALVLIVSLWAAILLAHGDEFWRRVWDWMVGQ